MSVSVINIVPVDIGALVIHGCTMRGHSTAIIYMATQHLLDVKVNAGSIQGGRLGEVLLTYPHTECSATNTQAGKFIRKSIAISFYDKTGGYI